jgi:hypothetical protein
LAFVQTISRKKDVIFRDVIVTASHLQQKDLSMGVVVAIEDISNRKKAEDSLKRSEHL